MTPTPAEARAELERRQENKVRKHRGEPIVTESNKELVAAKKADLQAWAEGKT